LATIDPRKTHCQQVKAKSQPVGRKGLQRKSFLPPGGKKIEAESLVFGAGAPKMRTYFLNLLTLDF
jgi:hypothetical protein